MNIKQCKNCSKEFEFNKLTSNKVYCCTKCRIKYYGYKPKKNINNCLVCNTLTHNPKYCSRVCAAKINCDKIAKSKILKIYYCKKCGIKIYEGYKKHQSTLCLDCNPSYKNWSQISWGKFKQSFKTRFQANARIRSLARIRCKESPCVNCGYAKHTETCHIKPVSTFSDDVMVSEINDISNLIRLCPNCHWEFDNDLLKLDLINCNTRIRT